MENLDFFSKNFEFNLKRGEKKKKTFVGAIISILIIGLTLAYFIYVMMIFYSK
jgi:hypothetical protein